MFSIIYTYGGERKCTRTKHCGRLKQEWSSFDDNLKIAWKQADNHTARKDALNINKYDVLILLEHIFPNTYQGIINALYPATRWILAVLEF